MAMDYVTTAMTMRVQQWHHQKPPPEIMDPGGVNRVFFLGTYLAGNGTL
jgi:hypothetical protein